MPSDIEVKRFVEEEVIPFFRNDLPAIKERLFNLDTTFAGAVSQVRGFYEEEIEGLKVETRALAERAQALEEAFKKADAAGEKHYERIRAAERDLTAIKKQLRGNK